MKGFISLKNKLIKSDKLEVALSCVILLFLWEVLANIINNDIYIPTIGQTISSLIEILKNNRFYLDISFSIIRSIISFIGAALGALFLGIISYTNRAFRNFLYPINSIIQSIPTMILIVLAMIWFNKNNAPFIVGFAIVFPVLYDTVLSSLVSIDKNILEMAKLYKISLKDRIIKIYIPSIKFKLVPIIISTYSLVFKVVIAGEVYGQPNFGMGTMIQLEKVNFNTPGIFAWLIIIILISNLLNKLQDIVSRRTLIWMS